MPLPALALGNTESPLMSLESIKDPRSDAASTSDVFAEQNELSQGAMHTSSARRHVGRAIDPTLEIIDSMEQGVLF